jgi:dUTPase
MGGDNISDEELSVYLKQMQSKHKRKIIKANVTVDSEYVNFNYTFEPVPFERIRRITGYLVGTTARWNDAKQAEERDRVKHGVGSTAQ